MSALSRALIDEVLGDVEALEALVEILAPRLVAHLAPIPLEDGWLNAREAASYIGISTNALHKLTAAREIPFEQDCAGGKLWFKRSELDAWRRGDWKVSGTSASKKLPSLTLEASKSNGHGWARTSDLSRVKRALSH